MATKPRGGGLKALVAGPLRKEHFLAASLISNQIFYWRARQPLFNGISYILRIFLSRAPVRVHIANIRKT